MLHSFDETIETFFTNEEQILGNSLLIQMNSESSVIIIIFTNKTLIKKYTVALSQFVSNLSQFVTNQLSHVVIEFCHNL